MGCQPGTRAGAEGREVTAFHPDRRLAITGTLGPFAAELKYRLEPVGAGTRLTNEVALKPRGILGVVGHLARSRVKDAVTRNLGELKRILESDTP